MNTTIAIFAIVAPLGIIGVVGVNILLITQEICSFSSANVICTTATV